MRDAIQHSFRSSFTKDRPHPSINSTGATSLSPISAHSNIIHTPIQLTDLSISPLQLKHLIGVFKFHTMARRGIHTISHLPPEHLNTCLDFGFSHRMISPPTNSIQTGKMLPPSVRLERSHPVVIVLLLIYLHQSPCIQTRGYKCGVLTGTSYRGTPLPGYRSSVSPGKVYTGKCSE
jgi:hypothetical protein